MQLLRCCSDSTRMEGTESENKIDAGGSAAGVAATRPAWRVLKDPGPTRSARSIRVAATRPAWRVLKEQVYSRWQYNHVVAATRPAWRVLKDTTPSRVNDCLRLLQRLDPHGGY